MSVPNTSHALPARERSAVRVDPKLLTFIALYPGQASRVAGSTKAAAATPRNPRRARGFDKTAMGGAKWSRGRMGTSTKFGFAALLIASQQGYTACFKYASIADGQVVKEISGSSNSPGYKKYSNFGDPRPEC